jgi:hypothetical protein
MTPALLAALARADGCAENEEYHPPPLAFGVLLTEMRADGALAWGERDRPDEEADSDAEGGCATTPAAPSAAMVATLTLIRARRGPFSAA